MRNVAVLIATLLLIPIVRAADVEIGRPHIAFLSDSAASIACKGTSRRACTTVSTEFLCGCRKAGDHWSVRSRFIATPFIYTTTYVVLSHELEHISDIRASLNEYGNALALHEFSSETSCTSFMKDELKIFPQTMKLIQRITMVRRDGERFAANN